MVSIPYAAQMSHHVMSRLAGYTLPEPDAPCRDLTVRARYGTDTITNPIIYQVTSRVKSFFRILHAAGAAAGDGSNLRGGRPDRVACATVLAVGLPELDPNR